MGMLTIAQLRAILHGSPFFSPSNVGKRMPRWLGGANNNNNMKV